ncbi:hypothetical protein RHSIM_Rhsim12G0034900 [Rhododendron simsii]|uniref:Cystatin domain-containing protein n=1 Tax=Rhododendron simsii TaxID=118357 RepID=A0A834L959_RHOSS|nr:hypothetical protein RHSIM_Rhsim12G0034900 [Rhododendron simsii]
MDWNVNDGVATKTKSDTTVESVRVLPRPWVLEVSELTLVKKSHVGLSDATSTTIDPVSHQVTGHLRLKSPETPRKGRVDMADTRMAFVCEAEKQIVEPELINYSGTKCNRRLESSRPDGARKKSKLDGDKKKKSKLDGDKKKSKLDAYKLKPEIDYDSFDYDNFPVKQWMQMFRKFTSLEMMDYQRRLLKSGGFDVGDIPNNIHPRDARITPVRLDDSPAGDERLKELESYSKLALDQYNHNSEKTKYRFVKFLKANYCLHAYERKEYYYITFQAKDVACSEHSLPKNFQALVRAGKDEATVDFCRPEP